MSAQKTAMYTEHTKKIFLGKDHGEDPLIAGKTKSVRPGYSPANTWKNSSWQRPMEKNMLKRSVPGSE